MLLLQPVDEESPLQKEAAFTHGRRANINVIFKAVSLYPSGWADVVLLLKLLELPFLGFVLLGKASDDLAYLTR